MIRELPKKLALSTAVFVFVLVCVECALRTTATSPFDSGAARRAAEDSVALITGNQWSPDGLRAPDAEEPDEPEFRLHPYIGFDVGASDRWMSNDLSRFQKIHAARMFDIVVLGGSVAARFAHDCAREIAEALEADPAWSGWQVRVFSHGRAGFRQPQPLYLLEYMFALGYRPDVVIEIDGFNEVALGVQNVRAGVHPVMPSIAHWTHLASDAPLTPAGMDKIAAIRREQLHSIEILEQARTFGLFHTALTSWTVQRRLDQVYRRFAEADRAYAKHVQTPSSRSYFVGPPFEGTDEDACEAAARIWVQCSLDMDAICRRRGIRYLHVLQPTLHDVGAKPVTEEEARVGAKPEDWALGAKLGYPILRAHSAELTSSGVEFLDASQVFSDVSSTLYVDLCHFTIEGNRILAESVNRALLSSPPGPPPPPRSERKRLDAQGSSR